MNAELKRKWIAALRSGEYQQARGTLHHKGAYCCLGVWCALNGYTVREDSRPDFEGEPVEGVLVDPSGKEQSCAKLVDSLMDSSVSLDTQYKLASLNDGGASFADIADWITEHIPEDAA